MRGDLTRLRRSLARFARRAANDPLAPYLLGGVALARRDLTGGRQYLEETLKLDPNFAPASLSLAALDTLAGRKADAKRRYEDVISRAPKSLPAMLGLAQLALEERDISGCEKLAGPGCRSRPQRFAGSHRQDRFAAGGG